MTRSTQFYAQYRHGVGTALAQTADANGLPGDAAGEVIARLEVGGLSETIEQPMALRGPGDVLKLDAEMVARVEPAPGSSDCAPNFFPYIEFSDPALPWIYTPSLPSPEGRLVPWLTLVVLRDDGDMRLAPLSRGAGLMLSLDARAGAVLPDLAEAHVWAHVEDRNGAGAGAQGSVARILCPVRLDRDTAYVAALVPVFEAGRLVGLDRDPATAAPGELSWGPETDQMDLPVYHHWSFTTGAVDFEELVRRLKPYQVDAQMGLHDLDISRPRGPLDARLLGRAARQAAAPLSYQGALTAPAAKPNSWPQAHRQAFEAALETALGPQDATKTPEDYSAADHDPLVTPPVYGNWQSAGEGLEAGAARWKREVNLDPTHRAVAGLGAAFVRRNQEDLMAQAWAVAKGARPVQQHLRQSRVALSVSGKVHARLGGLSAPSYLQVTGRLHASVSVGAASVAAHLGTQTAKLSALPAGVLSPEFRRLSAQPASRRRGTTAEAATALCLTGEGARLAEGLRPLDQGVRVLETPRAGKMSLTASASREGLAAELGLAATPGQRLQPAGTPAQRDRKLKATAARLGSQPIARLPAEPPAALPAAAELRQGLLAQTRPAVLLPQLAVGRVEGLRAPPKGRVPIPPRVEIDLDYPTPAYSALVAAEPDGFMPGFGRIPSNSVSLVATNSAFVESYLLGINHELAREFAWRQYPIRLDGTWMRRFWNYTDDPARTDIDAVRIWPKTRPLGGSGAVARDDTVIIIRSALFQRFPDTIVYAVPGQWVRTGELPRMPEATARFQPATSDGWHRVPVFDDPGRRLMPEFSGQIGAMAAFFGFDRQPAALIGEQLPKRGGGDPGWFIVFEQPRGLPRFGLDAAKAFQPDTAPRRADALSWGRFAASAPALAALTHAPAHPTWAAREIEGKRWGNTSSETAALALQSPVRMAVHVSALIQTGGGL